MLRALANDGTQKPFSAGMASSAVFVPLLLGLLAHWSGESGVNAVTIQNWAVKAVLLIF
jgi:hypothetical protein